MPFAAAIVLIAALGIYSYQVGKRRAMEVDRAKASATDTRMDALEQQMSDLGHERDAMKAQVAGRDLMIAELQRQMVAQSATLSEAKSVQAALGLNLERTLRDQAADKKKVAQEQSNLSQQLTATQALLDKTQTELASLQQQRAQGQARSESLEAQIKELHGLIHDREQALDKEEELLAHDRDIRELMGARELYIAEVYDVAKDGQTKKPYGRVFYTRGKSLVFYAYDLDQQNGLKRGRTFQAWGSRGVDRQQATSLGMFYEDSAAKKRWVLKSDDPKKLEQIDAVFVTVEPNGGSVRPSGKPLLFAYLKVEPNHP
jgi:myosin heavy subunit